MVYGVNGSFGKQIKIICCRTKALINGKVEPHACKN